MSDNHSLNHYHLSTSSKVYISPSLKGGGRKKKTNYTENKKKSSSSSEQKESNQEGMINLLEGTG